MRMTKPFYGEITEYDANNTPTKIDVFLAEPADKDKAQEVMKATGMPTELDAVIMVFRRYQPDFLKWWKGDNSSAPAPIAKSEVNADELQTPSVDPSQPTQKNR